MSLYDRCVVGGCDETKKTERLLGIPKNQALRKLWMSFLVQTNPLLLGVPERLLGYLRVCRKHFDETQFDHDGKRIPYSYPCLVTKKEIENKMLDNKGTEMIIMNNDIESNNHVDALNCLITGTLLSPASKKRKSPAERQRAYRLRRKKEKQEAEQEEQHKKVKEKQPKKSTAEYQRQYRLRKKLMNSERHKNRNLFAIQAVNETSDSEKLTKLESDSKTQVINNEKESEKHVDAVNCPITGAPLSPASRKRKSSAERQRAYRLRMKQKKQFKQKKVKEKLPKKSTAKYQREYRLRKKLITSMLNSATQNVRNLIAIQAINENSPEYEQDDCNHIKVSQQQRDDEKLTKLESRMNKINAQHRDYDDSFDHFGKMVATQLKSLPMNSAFLLQEQLQDAVNRFISTVTKTLVEEYTRSWDKNSETVNISKLSQNVCTPSFDTFSNNKQLTSACKELLIRIAYEKQNDAPTLKDDTNKIVSMLENNQGHIKNNPQERSYNTSANYSNIVETNFSQEHATYSQDSDDSEDSKMNLKQAIFNFNIGGDNSELVEAKFNTNQATYHLERANSDIADIKIEIDVETNIKVETYSGDENDSSEYV